MKSYIGTKLINAMPMNRAAYNIFRGWELPADENGEDEGYLVEYLDGGEPNTDSYDGYVSWSPKTQFDNAYHSTDGMNLGLAIEAMKDGLKVSRAGWNGKNMWLIYVPGSAVFLTPKSPYETAGLRGEIEIGAHIDMYTAQGIMQPGWLASQADMLADDYFIVI